MNTRQPWICLVAAVLFTSCSQDERDTCVVEKGELAGESTATESEHPVDSELNNSTDINKQIFTWMRLEMHPRELSLERHPILHGQLARDDLSDLCFLCQESIGS